MRKGFRKFMDSMLWTIPVFWAVILAFIRHDYPELWQDKTTVVYALAAAVLGYLWMSTTVRNRASPDDMREEKRRAQHKAVRPELRSKKPEGVFFGKQGSSYIRKPICMDGHVLVVNPSDRRCAGYDPLYMLTQESSEMEIYETMRLISESLISLPADLKDPFWKTSARNLLTGLLIYYYKEGNKNFIALVDRILSKPVKDSVQEIMEKSDPTSTERKYAVQFADLAEETLGGVVMEMNNHLALFANDRNVQYALRDNPVKATPKMLNDGYSIYLAVREHQLSSYYDFLQLVLNQTFFELEQRPENAQPVLYILDELPRLLSAGRLERLLDGSKTLRSRKVTLYLVIQSFEALTSAYSESQALDLISNSPFILVLDAASTKTQKMVVEWAGKYTARKKSWTHAAPKTSTSTSFEEKHLVGAGDIMMLRQKKQAMLVSPYGFYFIDKAPYYQDPVLSKLSAECIACNESINKM